jgi:hypothetical protein
MVALARKMTKAELDAVYLVSFAASCSMRNDWKVLEEEILARLQEAEKRGARRKNK